MSRKKNSTAENIALIHHHGERLAKAFYGAPVPTREEIAYHAERVFELLALLPDYELGKAE